MLPTPNPYALVLNAGVAFNGVKNALLWLDAADSNVFTGSDPWIDKSQTGNNAINGTAGISTMPTVTTWNGIRAARFVAGSKNSMKTTNTLNIAPNVTTFVVARIQDVGAGFILINSSDGSQRIEIPSGSFPLAVTTRANPNVASNVTAITAGQGQGFLLTLIGNIWTVYANGSWVASRSALNATASQIYFGSAAGDSGYATIDIGEIIIYNSRLLTGQQAVIEGYLAWKWGLVADLPISHPYKYFKP
jgi:hypothetical protein